MNVPAQLSRQIAVSAEARNKEAELPGDDLASRYRPRPIEIIEYGNIQVTKAPHVLRGMGLALDKNEKALHELADKGMAQNQGDKPQH